MVLLAEHEGGMRRVAAEVLTEAGFSVREAGDGVAALDELHRRHPDLVVADLNLPGMNALQLLRQVRADRRLSATAFIVLCRVAKPGLIRALREAGADGFLDRDQLVDTLAFRARSVLASRIAVPHA